MVIIVEEDGEVVLAGWKWVQRGGLSSFEGWWRRTVTIEMRGFGRGSG